MDTLRKLLAVADVGRDPYAVAEGAGTLLDVNGEDAIAGFHYLRALGALGLTGVAKKISHAGLAEQLAKVTSGGAGGGGAVAWSSRARRFKANLAALGTRYPEAVKVLEEAAGELAGYELHQSTDTNLHIREASEKLAWKGWLQDLANHRAMETVWNFDRTQTPVPAPMAFDGVGYGWLLQRIANTTAYSFQTYSCALYVLEPDPVSLAMVLHLHDLQPLLSSPRLRLFLGKSGEEVMGAFRRELETIEEWSVPQRYITDILRPREGLKLQEVCEEIHRARGAKMEERRAAIDASYAGVTLEEWKRRFAEAAAGKRGLTVLGITTRYSTVLQHSMREMEAAVEADGHRFLMAIEPDDQSLENPFQRLIAEHRPDLVLQMSRLRYENPWLPRGVPYLSWDQDNLPCMRTAEAGKSLDRLTYVAGHAAFHGYVYLGWPRANCVFCQLAAATHRYAPKGLLTEDAARYGCDFSYVSNASGTAETLRHSLAARFASHNVLDAFVTLTDSVLAEPSGWGSSRAYGQLIQYEQDRHITLTGAERDEIVMHALTVADRAFRHLVLKWVADYADAGGLTLKLFGHGWDGNARFAEYAAGAAHQGEQLRAIYQASRINLQIIETGFLHSRALDGLAAGGFFLTRRTAYDGTPEVVAARMHLAKLARAGKVRSVADLEGATDGATKNAWRAVREQLNKDASGNVFRPEEFLRGLVAFVDLPAACTLPHFEEIAFSDRAGFVRMADRFLKSAELRAEVAGAMREAVLEKYSYDARWKQFLGGVAAGLAEG